MLVTSLLWSLSVFLAFGKQSCGPLVNVSHLVISVHLIPNKLSLFISVIWGLIKAPVQTWIHFFPSVWGPAAAPCNGSGRQLTPSLEGGISSSYQPTKSFGLLEEQNLVIKRETVSKSPNYPLACWTRNPWVIPSLFKGEASKLKPNNNLKKEKQSK